MEEFNRDLDRNWILFEEGYIHTTYLTKIEAERLKLEQENLYPELGYRIQYDEYQEFTDAIENE